jgi:transcriptional regulator with XRE-family HTH domain
MIPRFRASAGAAAEKTHFAKKLVELLRDNSMNQADLARYLGVSRDATSTWCRGRSMPEPVTLNKIAKKFNVDPSIFLLPAESKAELMKGGPTKFNPAEVANAPRSDRVVRMSVDDDGRARITLDVKMNLSEALAILKAVEDAMDDTKGSS